MTEHAQLMICTLPDTKQAEALAQRLVEERLAACVNILPGMTSVYRWQDKIESDQEVLLLIKTHQQVNAALQTRIQALHPYELPEIVAVPITDGLPAYLAWIKDSTGITP